MSLRFIPLLAGAILVGACGSADSGAGTRADVRYDTVAGFQLGMLLPEARELATSRGDPLECEPVIEPGTRGSWPDSAYEHLREVDNCMPYGQHYTLSFRQGLLEQVTLSFSADWERIPVDTLVSRLSQRVGATPAHRSVYTYPDGKRELLISWVHEGRPGIMLLRCPEGGPANHCAREHYLDPGES